MIKSFLKRVAFASAALVPLAGIAADAPNWPQWNGPNHDNISPDTGLLQDWPEGGPKLLWKSTDVGKGYSTVSIAEGRIYTMGDDNDNSNLIALDMDGKLAWKSKLGKPGAPPTANPPYPGTRATPTYMDGMLYCLNQHGVLVCVKASDGSEVWRKDMARDFGGKMMSGWGYAQSPLADDGKIICAPGGKNGTVAALNPKDGSVVWRSKGFTDSAIYGSVIAADIAGVHQYIVLTDQHLAGVSPADGSILWMAPRKGGTAVIPTPVFKDGIIFVTSGYGAGCNGFQITKSGDKFEAKQLYANKEMVNHQGGVVVVDDKVYGSSDPGILKCMDLKTGDVLWKDREPGKGTISYADKRLYFRDEKGKGTVWLIEATPAGYKPHGHFDPPDRSDQPSWQHIVVVGGRMYIRDMDVLLCYDVKAQ